MAEEEASVAAGDPTTNEVIRRETQTLIKQAIDEATTEEAKKGLRDMQNRLERGETTDKVARDTISLILSQQKDSLGRKVLGDRP